MSKTAEALTKVLQSTVEQLVLDGVSPREIVVNLLEYGQCFSEQKLPELARAQIEINDAITGESNRWAKEESEWASAARTPEGVDFDYYHGSAREHQELIEDDQAEADRISALAGVLSTAVFQASTLLDHIKALKPVPSLAKDEIVDMLVARLLDMLESEEEVAEYPKHYSMRFKTVLRSLVGFGSFGHYPHSSGPDDNSEEIPF